MSDEALLAHAREPGSARPAGLDALLAFEAERARGHYAAARGPPAGRPTAARCWRPRSWAPCTARVLEEWLRRGMPVGGPKLSLPRPRKAWIALRTIPRVYWGGL